MSLVQKLSNKTEPLNKLNLFPRNSNYQFYNHLTDRKREEPQHWFIAKLITVYDFITLVGKNVLLTHDIIARIHLGSVRDFPQIWSCDSEKMFLKWAIDIFPSCLVLNGLQYDSYATFKNLPCKRNGLKALETHVNFSKRRRVKACRGRSRDTTNENSPSVYQSDSFTY